MTPNICFLKATKLKRHLHKWRHSPSYSMLPPTAENPGDLRDREHCPLAPTPLLPPPSWINRDRISKLVAPPNGHIVMGQGVESSTCTELNRHENPLFPKRTHLDAAHWKELGYLLLTLAIRVSVGTSKNANLPNSKKSVTVSKDIYQTVQNYLFSCRLTK